MDLDHEYSVLGGYNRAKIGHAIGAMAAAVSTVVVSVVTGFIDLVENLGFGDYIPRVIAWPLSAGVIYALLYLAFARHAWKIWPFKNWLKVPNLAGNWLCEGRQLNADRTVNREWSGEIIITQNWDKLRIRLKTKQSGSVSIAAALSYDSIDGYRLLYNYKNDPRADQPELQPHRGFADLTFNPTLTAAEGEYFNGIGRFTFGILNLTRQSNG